MSCRTPIADAAAAREVRRVAGKDCHGGLAAAGIEPVLPPPAPAWPQGGAPCPPGPGTVFDGTRAQHGEMDERTAEPELRGTEFTPWRPE
ncbi:hypothetical protein GCM10010381_54150 [Streptomyces xantholiticus]|nr:hypothetical protein GCM10010381_54150 [Streptomyces xantholiticus]